MQRLHVLDAKDRHILALLEADSRRSNSEIARLTAVSAPTVAERIARLRDAGIIEAFTTRIDPRQVGLPTSALIKFRGNRDTSPNPVATVRTHPAVRTSYRMAEGEEFMLVYVSDIAALNQLLTYFSHYGETETALVLSTEFQEQPFFGSPS